ncbi:Diuretic hormone receptor [Amphibalanus amphitrite]|uniref:Diuretic hormone receptor n=1 Tax=Amphibalanus amphitrite TaxID=1232801 RepID=A0A6A4VGR9_AMPAM|nr:Diuretic hormone receptor [Amphibalanus amphitrite]
MALTRRDSRPLPLPLLLVCLLVPQLAPLAAAQSPSESSRGQILSTGERQRLCEDSEDGSSRSRRSSEWSREQQVAAGAAGEGSLGSGGCPRTWDGALCWPPTGAGTNRSVACFHEFRGVLYDTSGRASRTCLSDGVWASSADYSACRPLLLQAHPCAPGPPPPSSASVEAASAIYLTGYSASLVALVAAVAIFRHFKELRCPRNTIHTNLFVACMVNDALWITVMTIEMAMAGTTPTSCGLVILLHFFHVATFFWMFVEGLNLYMMVVQTFMVDRVRAYLYPLIGWGVPFLVVATWSVVKSYTSGEQVSEEGYLSLHNLCVSAEGNYSFVRGLEPPLDQAFLSQCPWLEDSEWDWIHIAPSLMVLACNVVFLVKIMCVLITKLRSTNSSEAQQYKKATKALLVLLPLLGVTYILVLVAPSTKHVIYYIQTVLVSVQGLIVSLLYCFCNTEVQSTLKKHWYRWRGRTYLRPADMQRTRPGTLTSRLKAAGDTSATDLTYTTAMDSDAV